MLKTQTPDSTPRASTVSRVLRWSVAMVALAALAAPAAVPAQTAKPAQRQQLPPPVRHLTLCVDMSNTDIGTVTVERGPCELGKGELGGGGGDGGGPTKGGSVTGPKGLPDFNRCEIQLRAAQARCKTVTNLQNRQTCEGEALATFMRCEAAIAIR